MIRSEHGRETGMMQNFRGPTQEQHSKGKGVLAQPDDGNNEDLREHESFQVAVAIAMPKPKENHGLDPGETVLDSEVYEYSIGVCRVPCG
ncbi:hypothetical protein GYMLUDRAFT_39306 [Collybiopsis luxurians FD-317 M1]|nr:hypothetical protein GYMLUDRAFT_39306 [Collybiopsis luxurians FD-317 M1]